MKFFLTDRPIIGILFVFLQNKNAAMLKIFGYCNSGTMSSFRTT